MVSSAIVLLAEALSLLNAWNRTSAIVSACMTHCCHVPAYILYYTNKYKRNCAYLFTTKLHVSRVPTSTIILLSQSNLAGQTYPVKLSQPNSASRTWSTGVTRDMKVVIIGYLHSSKLHTTVIRAVLRARSAHLYTSWTQTLICSYLSCWFIHFSLILIFTCVLKL